MKEAHGIVVTDVAFVPESQRGRELLAGNEAALLSVAVDSRCKLHLLPSRRGCRELGCPPPPPNPGEWGPWRHLHPCVTHRLPPCLAAAAALCRAHRGHHPAAAARLPRLPVAPCSSSARTAPTPGLDPPAPGLDPPSIRTGPPAPGQPLRPGCAPAPQQTVKQRAWPCRPAGTRGADGGPGGCVGHSPAGLRWLRCGAGPGEGVLPAFPQLLPLNLECEGSAVPSVRGERGWLLRCSRILAAAGGFTLGLGGVVSAAPTPAPALPAAAAPPWCSEMVTNWDKSGSVGPPGRGQRRDRHRPQLRGHGRCVRGGAPRHGPAPKRRPRPGKARLEGWLRPHMWPRL